MIVRKPVADRLADGVGRVVAVSAPAGYGKTTQVAVWAAQDPRPVAWATLEPGDNDPSILGPLLTDLLRDVGLETGDLPGTGLPPEQQVEQAAPVLGHLVRTWTSPFVLVLDDVHVLEDGSATGLVDALLANLPPDATVVLVGRTPPAGSLAHLRLKPGLVEVGASELALDAGEAERLFDALGLDVDLDAIGEVVEAFEGWPAGIRLVAASLRERPGADPAADLARLARVGAVADFVAEEWLQGLDPDEQAFLRRVSGLDWLSGSLCDHVLEASDSGELLHRLHKHRLLALPLDAHGTSYRLHHLVRGALDAEQERRSRAERRAIDLRASDWFERAGDIDRALHHAVRADDLSRAEHLVTAHAVAYRTTGRHLTVQRWLDLLPPDHVRTRPALCLVAALVTAGVGRGEEAVEWLRVGAHAAASADGGPHPVVSFEIAAQRAMLSPDSLGAALTEARTAAAALPPGQWHAAACWVIGGTSWEVGDPDAALPALSAAAAEAGVVGSATVEAQARAMLAVVLGASGDQHLSEIEALAARRVARDAKVDLLPSLFLVVAVSARVAAIQGDAELAATEAATSRRNLELFGRIGSWLTVPARIVLADTYRLLGDLRTAAELLEEVELRLRGLPEAVGLALELDAAVERLDRARAAMLRGAQQLTAAELRVVQCLATNLTLADIAERLFISRNTAKTHAAAAYRKLGVTSRREAVDRARDAGLMRAGEEILSS